jgi:spermidine/putrescine transport system substrate-binding protein
MKIPLSILAVFALLAPLMGADAPGMLRVLAFERTIPREVCLDFAEKTGIGVDVTTAPSSVDAANFLYTKKEPFDLLLVSNDVVRAMRDRNLLLPLDPKKISNFSKVKLNWFQATGDPHGKFRLPLDAAAMGVLVDLRVTQPEVKGYSDAFRKPRPGGVAVMVDQRDMLAAALLSLGASVNDLNPDNLRAARVILTNWLRNTAPTSKGIWGTAHSAAFDSLRAAFVQGRHGAALLYSGDALSLMTEFPGRYAWVNPTEGSLKYLTVCAIPTASERPEAAHRFIDFILQPGIARELIFGSSRKLEWASLDSILPVLFQGNPKDIAASQLMDDFSVQTDITREPRQAMEEFFRSLPDPSAPPAP